MYKLINDTWVEYEETPIPPRPSPESCPVCGKTALLMTLTIVHDLEITFKRIYGTLGASYRMCYACYNDRQARLKLF